MRRERGKPSNDSSVKNILYLLGTMLGISIIVFIVTFITYNNNSDTIDTEKIAQIVSNTTNNASTEQASSQISKTIEEVKEEALLMEEEINTIDISQNTETIENKENENQNSDNEIEENTVETTVSQTEENKKELEFINPVEGNISKEFAKDNLVYSETLKEWVTHYGIDIEAEKTTVVKAVEDGTVTAIKSDPRYGITVIIKHEDGFETRYANLLTSEYVVEGEKVTKGQTIGTVGNTATFEISDNTHLHFEMLKDDEYVNPTIYIK
jgi:murein DD-endopeptidase MepM/ murein hydrolase activator NlpD